MAQTSQQTAVPEDPKERVPPSIRFDRNELAGAFGDIGTDLPLIVGMTLAAKLDGTSVLVVYGLMQILTALRYRMPMPVQPLKAMAALVIAGGIGGPVLFGAGLAIGVSMLILSVTGLVDLLARIVPKIVVRGIQLGLGLQLATIALKDYVRAEGATGYALALLAFVLTVWLIGNRRFPAALFVILLGLVYAFSFKLDFVSLVTSLGFGLPRTHIPRWSYLVTGFFLLTLPQIPLSIGNSVLATRQVSIDLFPERKITVRQISLTYSLMNLISPFLSGVPVCHGSGGMVGHYAFGGRTGGSVFIYGSFFLLFGLFFGRGFDKLVGVFPLPVLGVMLLFEGLALMLLIRDVAEPKRDLAVVVLVGLIASSLPYGYVIGLIAGTVLAHLTGRGVTGLAKF